MEALPDLQEIIAPLLAARRKLREEFSKLHRRLLETVRDEDVCHRLMTIPGIGPVTSLAFICTIDVPARFAKSRAVGPSLGLTPVVNQSDTSKNPDFHQITAANPLNSQAWNSIDLGF